MSYRRKVVMTRATLHARLRGLQEGHNFDGSSLPSKVINILECPQILKEITNELSIFDCLNLTNTCRQLKNLRHQIWNINVHLHRFLKDPRQFRSIMAKHDALISGSDALQFLSRRRFKGSDLDVYIEKEAGVVEFASYLLNSEEYKFIPCRWQPSDCEQAIGSRIEDLRDFLADRRSRLPHDEERIEASSLYEMKAIDGVFTFRRKNVHEESYRQIQLIATRGPPLYAILNDFYMTNIFNFYTWKKAYSIFPYHTFLKSTSYFTKPCVTDKFSAGMEKYTKRGWDICDFEEYSVHPSNRDYGPKTRCEIQAYHDIRQSRRVGDKHTWCMDFDITGIEIPTDRPTDLLELTTFGMDMKQEWKTVFGWTLEEGGLGIKCTVITSTSLRQSLIVDNINISWKEFVLKMVKIHSKHDKDKTSLASSQQHQGTPQSSLEVAKLPERQYRDDDVRIWWDIHASIEKERSSELETQRQATAAEMADLKGHMELAGRELEYAKHQLLCTQNDLTRIEKRLNLALGDIQND
ncbi:hypothetical protein AA313_de0205989 [Arthrobotrys entomopaga]|nr:hypothetical protein AA313_de0205989 [Arthrobotrys entomopaga]